MMEENANLKLKIDELQEKVDEISSPNKFPPPPDFPPPTCKLSLPLSLGRAGRNMNQIKNVTLANPLADPILRHFRPNKPERAKFGSVDLNAAR
jgi:hypothetical protein